AKRNTEECKLTSHISGCECKPDGRSQPGMDLSGWGKVAVSGSNPQTSAAVAARSELYFSKRAITIGITRLISDRVLAANSARNVAPDSLQIIERIWKVRTPSAQSCDLPQHARISVTIGFVIDTDGVDRCTRPLCNLEHITHPGDGGSRYPLHHSAPRAPSG